MDGLFKPAAALAFARGAYGSDNIRYYDIIDSTMDAIDEAIAKGKASDGFTVVAKQQRKGRGSSDREWKSPLGNVYLSRATFVAAHECGQEMEMIAACAVTEIIRELLPDADVRFKYPNDILVNDKKIGGCLVPPIYDLVAGIARIVNLGVGINVAKAPHVEGKETTCLVDEGASLSTDEVIRKFRERFNEIRGEYHVSKAFDTVLRRMDMLDPDGQLTVQVPVQCQWRGTYAGFKVYKMGGEPKAWLLLESNGRIYRHMVHRFDIVSDPQRGTAPSLVLFGFHATAD
jgi:BirA family biotin operon repressor/biotin-[acetyl-CoA-carboxylase] ligase